MNRLRMLDVHGCRRNFYGMHSIIATSAHGDISRRALQMLWENGTTVGERFFLWDDQ